MTALQRSISTEEDQPGHLSMDRLPCWGYAIEREALKAPNGRDKGATAYLQELFDQLAAGNGGEQLAAALYVEGDGHCLVHALSRSLVGQEFYWHALRTDLHHRLRVDKDL